MPTTLFENPGTYSIFQFTMASQPNIGTKISEGRWSAEASNRYNDNTARMCII